MQVAARSNLLLRKRPCYRQPLRPGTQAEQPLQHRHTTHTVAKIARQALHRGQGRTIIGANLSVVTPRIQRFALHAKLLFVQRRKTRQKLRPRLLF